MSLANHGGDAAEQEKNASEATSFRAWAHAVYARPEIEKSLVKAQDEAGLSVNLMLWCCWTGWLFETAPEIVIRKAMADGAEWREEVVAKLREARRALKPFENAPAFSGAATLRVAVKQSELDAEHIEIEMLDAMAKRHLQPAAEAGDAPARARRNLASYAALAGAVKHKGFSTSLLHELIDNIFRAGPSAKPQESSFRE